MAIGDLLFSILGQPNPRDQLAMAMGSYPGQPGSNAGPMPGPGAGAAAPGLAAQAEGQPMPINNGGAAPLPSAPPEPQAYQSPQDMTGLYLKLMDRAYANASIDRGLGLLMAGMSHNQGNRELMVGAMDAGMRAMGGGLGGGNVGQMLMDLTNMQQTALKIGLMRQTMGNLPSIAKQLNMPLAQVQAAYASGALDDILKASFVTGTPLNHAQVQEAVARAAEAGAQTQKAQAETAAIPSEIALRGAQEKKALAEAAGPTEETRNYNYAMAQLPAGAPRPTFDEWVAQQRGAVTAATQTNLLQTQMKMNAQNQLPEATEKVVDQLRNADAILSQTNTLKNITGLGGTRIGQVFTTLPGTAGRDLQERVEQLRGSTGVAAVESLKGVGRILGTEFTEGMNAQSRLQDQSQSFDSYVMAIKDYRQKIANQLRILYGKAGAPVSAELDKLLSGPQAKTPIEDIMKKYGH